MPSALFLSAPATIALILAAMTIIAAVEAVVPLHSRGRWHRDHLAPNLALTVLTFATNSILGIGLLGLIVVLEGHDAGLLRWLSVPPLAAAVLAVAAFDLAFYAAHWSWHRFQSLWRFHAAVPSTVPGPVASTGSAA